MSNLANLLPIEKAALAAINLPVSVDTLTQQRTDEAGLSANRFEKQLQRGKSALEIVSWFKAGGKAELSEQGVDWTVGDISEKLFHWSANGKFINKAMKAAKNAEHSSAFVSAAQSAGQSIGIENFNKWVNAGCEFAQVDDTLSAEDAPNSTEETNEESSTEETTGSDVVGTFCWKTAAGNISLTIRINEQGNLVGETSNAPSQLKEALETALSVSQGATIQML